MKKRLYALLTLTLLLFTCSDDPVIGDFNSFDEIPKGLTATRDRKDSTIQVSWNEVSNASSYNLIRTDDPVAGEYSLIGKELEDTLFVDRAITIGTKYYYRVSSVFSSTSDTSVSSDKVWGLALKDSDDQVDTLLPPQNLTASVNRTDSTILLSWEAVSGAKMYEVQRGTKSDGSDAMLIDSVKGGLQFRDTEVTCDQFYYYAVRVFTEKDSSEFSSFVKGVAPSQDDTLTVVAPENLTASTDRMDSTILVAWDPVLHAEGYRLQRSQMSDGSSAEVIATLDDKTMFSDSDITVDKSYFYAVQALFPDTVSEFSSFVEGNALTDTTGSTFPDYLSIDAADGVSLTSVTIEWSSCGTSAKYDLYASALGEDEYTLLKEGITDTLYAHDDALPGPYTYKVIAYNEGGDSLTAIDEGYRQVTPKEFFLEVNKTYKYSQAKIGKLNAKELGKESAGGDIHGTLEYDSWLNGFKAKAKLTYDNYKDFYLVLNGVQMTNIDGLISQDGDVSDTVKVAGIYTGFIDHHITVDGGDPDGGFYTVGVEGVDTADVQFSEVKDAVLD